MTDHDDEDAEMLGRRAAWELPTLVPVIIDPGLTSDEFERVRQTCGIEFSTEHRAFLSEGLPVGQRWPNWREPGSSVLRSMLERPVDGVLFDVRRNGYWHPSWGPRPSSQDEALAIARDRLAEIPRMVPVYGHRYLPSGPTSAPHPVLSIWQTDVISYGDDLGDYLHREFGAARQRPRRSVTIPFWRDLVG